MLPLGLPLLRFLNENNNMPALHCQEQIQPQLEDGSQVDAIVYLWQDALRPLLHPPDWDAEEFREKQLARYCVMVGEFAADVAQHREWKGINGDAIPAADGAH